MEKAGAVAAGDDATAAAAAEILADGGNAFDAAIAALWASTVAEPVLSSLGGGGFLLASPIGAAPTVLDFFAHTPRNRRTEHLNFHEVICDFGTATQSFHAGVGAAATPGLVAGLFAIHERLATLPMPRLAEPAIRLARSGVRLSPIQAATIGIIEPIARVTPEAEAIMTLGHPDKVLPKAGDLFRWPALADTIDALCHEGERLFYRGDIARGIADQCRNGGHLTEKDLEDYRVICRRPLQIEFAGSTVLTNPAPSAGGPLIGFALALLDSVGAEALETDTGYISVLTRIMSAATSARIETELARHPVTGAERLISEEFLAAYRAALRLHPPAWRGTSHISIIDSLGNAAALSVSNGEGCGHIGPGGGFMLNNMLGEADLNPFGFNAWPENVRMSSMMAPTLLFSHGSGDLTAMGSGGSNRIRSAILQVIVRLALFGADLASAVSSPRIHAEDGILHAEAGFSDADISDALRSIADAPIIRNWPDRSMYFGGVHSVRRFADGAVEAAADPRRNGASLIVSPARRQEPEGSAG